MLPWGGSELQGGEGGWEPPGEPWLHGQSSLGWPVSRHNHGLTQRAARLSATSAAGEKLQPHRQVSESPSTLVLPRKAFRGDSALKVVTGLMYFLAFKQVLLFYSSSPPLWLQTSLLRTDIQHFRLTTKCSNLVTI